MHTPEEPSQIGLIGCVAVRTAQPARLAKIACAVKAVELTRSGAREVVAAAGVQPVPADSIVKGTIVDRAAVAGAIRTLLRAAAIRGRDVALSVPGGAVVAREITMPRMSPAELAGSIAWEAERHIP